MASDTKPEIRLRKALWEAGIRGYRKHYTWNFHFPKSIDIAFPGKKVAVFVDGCFWHQCPEHGTLPKSNKRYWKRKLGANVERDAITTNSLELSGWNVLRFWEHKLKTDEGLESAVKQVRSALEIDDSFL